MVDNHRISVTQETSVYDAKHLAESGFSAARIKERLEKHAYDASIYISVDSLEYLKKGGRITPAAAAFATVINLKPVLTIQGDKLDSFAKMRGMKLCEKKMIEAMQKDIETRFSDIPHTQLVIATAGTFENPADAEHWRQTVQNAFPDYDIRYSPLLQEPAWCGLKIGKKFQRKCQRSCASGIFMYSLSFSEEPSSCCAGFVILLRRLCHCTAPVCC